MRYILLAAFSLLLFFIATASATGQMLKGKVANSNGNPVSYAVIYIKELAQGSAANEQGEFSIKLKPGTYTCSFQSLGHQTKEQKVVLEGAEDVLINVTLEETPYMLDPALVCKENAEDPAFAIMRKVIGLAPYYLNQVSEYQSSVYLKGTLKVTKISGLVKMAAGKEIKQLGLKEGEEYLQESVNEIRFKAPNIFEQKVKSISSSFPKGMDQLYFTQMRFNIYNTNSELFISPLAPSAFSHYRFVFEGCSLEGERLISKIRVIPKQRSKLTVVGYLYVDEDSWSIKEFDLSGENIGAKYRNQQSFAEVKEGVFLPINYTFHIDISMMGNTATMNYRSVVKYEDIKVNPHAKSLAEQQKGLTPQASSPQKQKLDKKIEELLAKPNLSNRDAMELAKLMRKSADEARKLEEQAGEKKKDRLELDRTFKLEVDSLARKHDTLYWAEMRPIPLSAVEVKSYAKKDSLQVIEAADSVKRKAFTPLSLLVGSRYYMCDSSVWVDYDGLSDPLALLLNPVDGYSYGQTLKITKRFKDTTSFKVMLNGRYAFNRKELMGKLSFSYSYWPERRALLTLSGGKHSADFNEVSGFDAVNNTFTAEYAHCSYINFFDKRFIDLMHDIDLANGLTLTAGASYTSRRKLANTNEESFFFRDKTYRSNDPENFYVLNNPTLLSYNKAFILNFSLSYTPEYYYRRNGRVKRMVHSNYPTFTVGWKKGVAKVFGSTSNFDMGTFTINQQKKLGLLESLTYSATAGKFFNTSNMHFADFQHFNIQEPVFLTSPFTNGMHYLMQTYSASTNEWFTHAAVSYQTPYLLLKYLPLIRNTLWVEGLHFSYIKTPVVNHHMEVGYSLSNIGLLGNVGVFVGFDSFTYSSFGVKLSVMLSSFNR